MKYNLIKEIISGVGKFALVLFVLCFVSHIFWSNKKKHLTEKHETIRGYVYSKNGRWSEIDYRFTVNGKEYSGSSKYNQMLPYPHEGDSIDVFYDANDPDINLWSGCWQE